MNHFVVGAWVTIAVLAVTGLASLIVLSLVWLADNAPALLIPIGLAVGIGIAAGVFDWWTDPSRIKVRRDHGED